MAEVKARAIGLPPSFTLDCWCGPLAAFFLASDFFLLCRFLFRGSLGRLLPRFLLFLSLRLFLAGGFLCGFFGPLLRGLLRRLFLRWRLFPGRAALASARWSHGRRRGHRFPHDRHNNLVVFLYENGFFFLF